MFSARSVKPFSIFNSPFSILRQVNGVLLLPENGEWKIENGESPIDSQCTDHVCFDLEDDLHLPMFRLRALTRGFEPWKIQSSRSSRVTIRTGLWPRRG